MKKHYRTGFKGTHIQAKIGYSRKAFLVAMVHDLGGEATISDVLVKVIDFYIKSQPESLVSLSSVPDELESLDDLLVDDSVEILKAPRNRLTDHLKENLLEILDTHEIGEHPKIYHESYGLIRKYKEMSPLINNFLNKRGYSAREILAVSGPRPYLTFRLAAKTTRDSA